MTIRWQRLTRAAFAPFGDVIEAGAGSEIAINDGTTIRHDDLAAVDVGDGRTVVSIFASRPFGFPLPVRVLERHPRSSQAFVPLDARPYLVVVAPPGDSVEPGDIRAFLAEGNQGVNYHRGVWHHAAIVLEPMRFLVIDRGTKEPNCDFLRLPASAGPLVLERPDVSAVG